MKNLKKELSDYLIEYRDNLDIDDNLQFGTEIEYDNLDHNIVSEFLYTLYPEWHEEIEETLSHGGEVVSPILKNKKQTWIDLKNICNFLYIAGAEANDNVGSHIHFNASYLGYDMHAWKNLFELIVTYENVLAVFANGEDTKRRKGVTSMAYPISIEMQNALEKYEKLSITPYDIRKIGGDDKFQSFNFRNVLFTDITNNKKKNTIEMRRPNGTINPIIWQNNINVYAHLLMLAKRGNDKDYYNYRKEKVLEEVNYTSIDYIDSEGALHLANELFTSELDKMNFLKQYFKNFDEFDIMAPNQKLTLTK